jgi:ketosteroid isomerase-like protein
MSEQESIGLARRAYENFKSGDIKSLLASLTEDVDWRLPEMANIGFAGGRKGRERVGEFFADLAESQESLSFEPREFIAQGDKVVALGSYRWRVRKNGRDYGGEWAHVFTIRDGKIAGFHEYMDSAAAVAAHA